MPGDVGNIVHHPKSAGGVCKNRPTLPKAISKVNNGVQETAPRTRDNQSSQTELLEKTNGKRLDFGAASTPGKTDTPLENRGRKAPDQRRRRVRQLPRRMAIGAESGN